MSYSTANAVLTTAVMKSLCTCLQDVVIMLEYSMLFMPQCDIFVTISLQMLGVCEDVASNEFLFYLNTHCTVHTH